MSRGDGTGEPQAAGNTGAAASEPEEEPPKGLVMGFWTLVVLVKVGVLAVAAGAFVWVFTDHQLVGLALAGLGGLVIVRWVSTYRRLQDRYVSGEG